MNIRTTIRPAAVPDKARHEARPAGGCWFSLDVSESLKHQAGYAAVRLKVSG